MNTISPAARFATRREELVALAAAQRTRIGQCIEPWRAPLARVDRGVNILRGIRRHPGWVAGGIVAFTVLRRFPIGRGLQGAWLAWQILRRMRGPRA